MEKARKLKFLLFVFCTATIFFVTFHRGVLLTAPPYDVTAYLVILESDLKFSKPECVVASYLVVIVTTLFFHALLGTNLLSITLNTITVATFISFTRFSHPPALALTIFSYLTSDLLGFAITSIIVLAIIFGFSYATRLATKKRFY
ncbi:hypothetical protein B9Q13_00935 [Candidatus Marsarchaeota G2 archaeon ECH_B_SAG-G16]|jgi:HPP family.|uniref:HPP transmembrane region domain-containing protein n=4 Tax=Candidatus Marsarchaeota TaxID=1978152 RepID=A0A2R6AIB7_9ARCH|nr:MAG: hypothetical protein B9Q01_06115 [Candidatus Marsarchaeota G1 archaeon OSP_D]PSN86130.1 MAG: hypothetical protein B9Q02_03535 [Candidatus Marsarchaeota G1 archaeon BE_D]PSN87878.1 MAG: hypothetical protein B9Q00_07510 [Candidatus Marsarchaeota G1 archaeon OSP_C]PSO05753.1 MAG: hypothetical protein B9Q13_00935 [Candidatus Marsarchaeota G2 archaeon ECH_B_SAG-G16]